jgi:SAM-dependent methyltransferase
MTSFRAATRKLSRLVTGDVMAWRYLPYQLWTKFHSVDLSWASAEANGLSNECCHWHSNSGGPELKELLKRLEITPSDSILDIGCGKAGAMLTLRLYPFSRVDGIEISSQLARIANENLRRLRVPNARVFCCDAAEFHEIDEYTYLYMYNPFPEAVLRRVVKNLAGSLRRHPRRVSLIYKNPVFANVVLAAGFRKLFQTRQTHPDYPPFHVYQTDMLNV